MTTSIPQYDPEKSFATDAELHAEFEALLERASRRQVWMILLDAEQRIVGPLLPYDDYAEDPDEPVDTDDMGSVPISEAMLARVGSLGEMFGCTHLVLIWERDGSDRFTRQDLRWARAMANGSAGDRLRMRAQFVLHDTGMRQITPDDYM